jgi:hypothetical protein
MKFQYASGSRPLDGFVIKRGVGRGGFGEVYFATSDAGKELALKHIERNLEVELRGVGQCLNLKHPNLIDLYDIRYDENGDAWVVMEYVAGASLKDTIDRNPNGLPLEQVQFWFSGIAAGVAYLHDHGIVHRDLKPANIFEDGGYVKIGDYGLSKFISTSRRSGQTESVGTFHYMAPEIGKGVYGKEIDIYALGIVLFEMLTGRTPFDGESSQEIIMKHLTADPDLSGVPQPYRAVIERALQKDAARRFHNAAEMVAALESVQGSGERVQGSGFRGQEAKGKGPWAEIRNQRSEERRKKAEVRGQGTGVSLDDAMEGIVLGSALNQPEKVAGPYAEVVQNAAPAYAADLTGEEPIAKAVRKAIADFGRWWNTGPMNTPLKIGMLFGAAAFAIFNGPWLVAATIFLGSIYLVYLGIRLIVQSAGQQPQGAITPQPVMPQYASIPVPPRPEVPQPVPQAAAALPRSPGWHMISSEQRQQLLSQKTIADHAAELSGSMLWSAVVAAILTVVMTAISDKTLTKSAEWRVGPAWFWLMTTIGTWLVLLAGKQCERGKGEPGKRRFGMLIVGLLFGAIAFVTSDFLLVELGSAGKLMRGPGFVKDFYSSTGEPQLSAYLAYFGALFMTIGWWKLCDPLRSSRLRIAPILLAVMAAWMWQFFLPFPQPWGFMLVASIAIATQLSAPWISPAERMRAVASRQ